VVKLGCEQQPAVPPQRKGFWRWTDPYLTVYKSDYIPHDEASDVTGEKILTYYNVRHKIILIDNVSVYQKNCRSLNSIYHLLLGIKRCLIVALLKMCYLSD
jgi:hypothetical protein